MKKDEKPAASSAPPAKTDTLGKPAATREAQGEPPSPNDLDEGIDRPGFDLGGSSGGTHAGEGLGLGKDAFDTPGERRLPGRRPDNDLTIPRWGRPEPRNTNASDEKTSGGKTPPKPEKKKVR